MAADKLSEIEACVLALVSVDGPATPYAIRKVFLHSPNPQWSGSAGTIYPLIERLKRRKLIRTKVFRTGKRRGKRISLTSAGSRAVRSWLSLPVQAWVAGVPPDPLRTRIRFLGVLNPRQRRAFVQDAYQRMQAHVRTIQGDCKRKRGKGGFPYLMARGALLSIQSRCSLLKEVAEAVGVDLRDGIAKEIRADGKKAGTTSTTCSKYERSARSSDPKHVPFALREDIEVTGF